MAHVQVVKHREGRRVTQVEIRYTHGSQKRVHQALEQLGSQMPNTSAVERRNGTARRMSAHQVRRSLAFARRPETTVALGWCGVTVYNWGGPHRSLRQRLPAAVGEKVPTTFAGDGLGLGRCLACRQRDPAPPALPPTGVR